MKTAEEHYACLYMNTSVYTPLYTFSSHLVLSFVTYGRNHRSRRSLGLIVSNRDDGRAISRRAVSMAFSESTHVCSHILSTILRPRSMTCIGNPARDKDVLSLTSIFLPIAVELVAHTHIDVSCVLLRQRSKTFMATHMCHSRPSAPRPVLLDPLDTDPPPQLDSMGNWLCLTRLLRRSRCWRAHLSCLVVSSFERSYRSELLSMVNTGTTGTSPDHITHSLRNVR